MFREEDRLDTMFRDILDGGQEEVPAHIWDALEADLDNIGRARRKKAAGLWMRRIASGIAIAAAIAVAAVFTGLPSGMSGLTDDTIAVVSTPQDKPADIMIADAPESEAGPASDAFVPDAVRHPDSHGAVPITEETNEIYATSSEAATEPEAESREQTPETEVRDNSHNGNANIRKKESADTDDVWRDPFAEYGEDTIKERPGISLTLSGNAITNNVSAKQGRATFLDGPQHAPATPKENKVTENSESSYSIPLSFGVGARIHFTPRWSMSVGVNYTRLSRTFSGQYIQVAEDGTITNTPFSKIRNTQHYIGIPVNAYYSILKGDFVDFYAYAGGSIEKCLSNEFSMSDSKGKYTEHGSTAGVQFSANAGIGVEFIIADKVGLYIDPSVRYYFRNRKNLEMKNIRTAQPLMLGFEAGLRIRF